MKKYQIKKGFITQKANDKMSIFDGEESFLYTFNETATFIFEKLKQGWDEKKIIIELSRRYSISENQARMDVRGFIHDLKKKKIIL